MFQVLIVSLSFALSAHAWDNHGGVTRLSLQAYEEWDDVTYEEIEKVLPALSVDGKSAPRSREELAEQLQVRGGGIKWEWHPEDIPGKKMTPIDIISWSANEPDTSAMDQELRITEDQKYMGGFTGPSSQGFRHMFYRAWDWRSPVLTFHIPMHEMGQAPQRAQLFFDLARQAKQKGHMFWAYRFLGWGVHYVQDLGQPYHTSQFVSLQMLPLTQLVTKGWEAFINETTRRVANYHLSFEYYVEIHINDHNDGDLAVAFKVPRASPILKQKLENEPNLPIEQGVRLLALVSSELAPLIVENQRKMMGEILFEPKLNLIPGVLDENGKSRVDFQALDEDPKLEKERRELRKVAYDAISNTGVATRWYVDRFRAL